MKTIPLLLLCIPAYAALPPSPIARPAPLQSPKAMSQPKSTPMLRTARVNGSGYFWIPMTVANHKDLNFFGCNTNDPGCVLYDQDRVTAEQPAGVGIQVEFADALAPTGWTWAAQFYPPPAAMVSEFSRFYPSTQRPLARFYRAVPLVPPTELAPASGQPRVNPALAGVVRATTRKK